MIIIAYVPVLFAIVGAVIWAFAKPSKPSEFGRLLMLAGLIAVAMAASGGEAVIRLGH